MLRDCVQCRLGEKLSPGFKINDEAYWLLKSDVKISGEIGFRIHYLNLCTV